MIDLINLCRFKDFNYGLSRFKSLKMSTQSAIVDSMKKSNKQIVNIVAYCLMPTHIHMLLKQIENNGISTFIGKVLDSYSKYFNACHGRSGPLWTSRFKNVLVRNDEQLLHLTRYIHLNPASAGIIDSPEKWEYSSYNDYIEHKGSKIQICRLPCLFNLNSNQYRKFVADHKEFQRELSLIKSALIDEYSG